MIKTLAAKLAAGAASHQLHKFLTATHNPQEIQKQLLHRQLKLLAGSNFARDHRLDSVDTYADFVRKVPVRSYDQLSQYIEPMKQGKTHVLLSPNETLVMFALTSGTTGQPKYIPVTRQSVADVKRGWNVFGLKALSDHPNAFFRKIVQITSSAREEKTLGGTWAGAVTGLLAETQKWIVKKYYITPLDVAKIKDPLAKSYTVARLAIPEDVAFTSTANPSTVLRLAQTMAEHSEQIIRDVRDGTLTPPGDMLADVKASLQKNLKPNVKRARRLENVCAKVGRLLPKDVWNLEFLWNWTGGTLKLYLNRFPEFFGPLPVRDIGLLASEGRFSIPIDDNTPAGIVELTSNLLEFIPEDSYGQDKPTVLPIDQVKKGQRYYLVFSNATGLTRYDIGDLVEVVDFYNQTPMIAFLSKGSHIASLTGEKLTEHQVIEAMAQLSKTLNKKIESFLLCPHWDDPPYYALTLEQSDAGEHATRIAEDFDRLLCNLNIEYAAKRESLRLAPLRLQTVADGFFASDDLKRLATMGRSEQYKRKFLLNQPNADKDIPLIG